MSQEAPGWYCRGTNQWTMGGGGTLICWIEILTDWQRHTFKAPSPANRSEFTLALSLLGFRLDIYWLGKVPK
jgi:hypothetical protein